MIGAEATLRAPDHAINTKRKTFLDLHQTSVASRTLSKSISNNSTLIYLTWTGSLSRAMEVVASEVTRSLASRILQQDGVSQYHTVTLSRITLLVPAPWIRAHDSKGKVRTMPGSIYKESLSTHHQSRVRRISAMEGRHRCTSAR